MLFDIESSFSRGKNHTQLEGKHTSAVHGMSSQQMKRLLWHE